MRQHHGTLYEIGNYMHRFAYLYDDDQEFLLDIPVYK